MRTGTEVEPRVFLGRRAIAIWLDRSRTVRSSSAIGVAAGVIALGIGAGLARPGSAMVAVTLPIFLGSMAGLFTLSPLRLLRQSPNRSLDPADWARMLVGKAVVLIAIITKIVPRMQPGGGYSMLGAALVASAAVCFWQLPQGWAKRDDILERD